MKKTLFKCFIWLISVFLMTSCAKDKGENDEFFKKKRKEVNIDKKTEDQKSSLLGALGANKGGTTYNFATSNILWRASLNTLDFMPLNTVDYAGGVIITDWYSPEYSKESIKVEVRFVSNELKSSSVNVKGFKKICNDTSCKTANLDNNFNSKIKDNIIKKARDLKIQDEKNKTKK